VGQYLKEGTQLTTLQGVDNAVHIDFTVTQLVAAGLKPGGHVEVSTAGGKTATASIEAVDARVDPTTRNAWVRARLEQIDGGPLPGASVRVHVPVGPPTTVVTVPVQALRKGPGGDTVFLVAPDKEGKPRAHQQRVTGGPTLGNDVIILDGLKEGEQVAVSGSFKLREGVLVGIAGANGESNGNGRGQ
jgi:membrane fusion protein (multidrug efflux system)